MPVIGDGAARTNPIHPFDLAEIAVDMLESGPSTLDAGGPEIFTRKELAELACRAYGKIPRTLPVPPSLLTFFQYAVRPIHPRLAELVEFIRRVSVTDCVAPVHGTRRLGAYFAEKTGAGQVSL